jgi:hypothetical protein
MVTSKQGDQTICLEKVAQNVHSPTQVLLKLIQRFVCGKSSKKIWLLLYFSIKNYHSKHSPNKREFAQSGHPASKAIRRQITEENLKHKCFLFSIFAE